MQVSLWREWQKVLGVSIVLVLAVLSWHSTSWAWQAQLVGGRCKGSGERCNSTIGNAGGRGACCDPLRNAIQCAKSNPCTGGKPYKWAESKYAQGLQWSININNMAGQSGYRGLTEAGIIGAMKTAWDAWTKQKCTGFRHKYVSTTSSFMSYRDGKNLLFLATPSQWAQMGAGPSTLAFTRPVTDRNANLIDSDIAFNPTPGGGGVWKIGRNTQRFQQDITHIAAHEIGHAIGFAHSAQQKFLMYFASRPGPFPGLDQDDIDGLCQTYPRKNCTSDSDCGTCLSCQNKQCLPKNVPLAAKTCKPCSKPSDCGNTATNICIRTKAGNRCAQQCNGGCCPKGYRCQDFGVNRACIPDDGNCPSVRCGGDGDCGPGEICSGGSCSPKPVTRKPKTCGACSSDAQCGAGLKCIQFSDGKSRCIQKCESDNFCPAGFNCASTLGGRYCIAPDGFCPCTSDSECLQGEACKAAVCRPAICKYGCQCKIDGHCDKGYKCIQGQDGKGTCSKPCGGSAAYPAGAPGSSCNGRQCSLGARCYQMGGNTVCMAPCGSGGSCPNGGRCYRLGGQQLCLCQGSSECKSGQACNKSILGQFGGGACAPASANSQCDKGFTCSEVSRGVELCVPNSSGGPGGDCLNGKCKNGLLCLGVPGSPKGVCFEDCTQSKQCQLGGACILRAGQGRTFCGCRNKSDCKAGQTCKQVGSGVTVCTAASATTCNKNGSCEAANGENCSNCADCLCQNGAKCDNSGVCRSASCGNNTCERDKGEDCGTCAGDCKCDGGKTCEGGRCVLRCGNGTCERDKLEDCGTCPQDCKCDGGKVCSDSRCINPPQSCGNGTCERDKLEDCGTCAKDCICDSGRVCQQNRCVVATGASKNNNNNKSVNKGDGGVSSDDDPIPPPQACGCEADNGLSLSVFLWFGLLFLGLFGRRRHSF